MVACRKLTGIRGLPVAPLIRLQQEFQLASFLEPYLLSCRHFAGWLFTLTRSRCPPLLPAVALGPRPAKVEGSWSYPLHAKEVHGLLLRGMGSVTHGQSSAKEKQVRRKPPVDGPVDGTREAGRRLLTHHLRSERSEGPAGSSCPEWLLFRPVPPFPHPSRRGWHGCLPR